MKKTAIIALTLLLAGCTSQAEYLQKLSSYEGLSERQLIDQRGVPTNSYEIEGRKYLSYITTRSHYSGSPGGGSIYGGTGIGNRGAVFGTGIGLGTSNNYETSCENTFVIYKGIVTKSGYRGDCF